MNLFKDFIACVALVGLAGCASAPSSVKTEIEVDPGQGCENYRAKSASARTLKERGELLRSYDACRARVTELAGKYDASIVRRMSGTSKRDPGDSDFLLTANRFCLVAPDGKPLPKCFTIFDRRWAPSGWSLFLRDLSRAAVGAVGGFIGGKSAWALLAVGL